MSASQSKKPSTPKKRSTGKKAETRQRILAAAARTFRRDGYHATGVDKVMKEAGLTAGGFYSHFKSKDDLFTQALKHGFDEVATMRSQWGNDLSGREFVLATFNHYLSLRHVRSPAGGCPLPALMPEVARANANTRRWTLKAIDAWASKICEHLGHDDQEFAVSLIAMAAGAIETARVMRDDDRATEFLDMTRRNLAVLVDHSLSTQP